MKRNKAFQKLGVFSLALGAVMLSVQWKCNAYPAQQEQQQSQSQQQPPPPPAPPQNPQPTSQQTAPPDQPVAKERKVWTNDDVVLLRTPADNYLVEKEAKEAAQAGAAAKEAAARAGAKPAKEPPLDIKLPATPEETEKMLKNAQGDIEEETFVLDKLQKELLETPTGQQAEKQKEIDRLTANLETLRRDVKALQDHLREFGAKPRSENPPASPGPPSL